MFYSYDLKKHEYAKRIYSKSELATALTDTVEYYENANKDLYEENIALRTSAQDIVRAEYEKQIKNLKDRLAMSYGEFASEKEKQAYWDFEKRHIHDRQTSRENSGKMPYLIPTGTGDGTILYVVCPICGEKENITDTEVW